jgi:hypothetical protein
VERQFDPARLVAPAELDSTVPGIGIGLLLRDLNTLAVLQEGADNAGRQVA